jgi:hypothetical protein
MSINLCVENGGNSAHHRISPADVLTAKFLFISAIAVPM